MVQEAAIARRDSKLISSLLVYINYKLAVNYQKSQNLCICLFVTAQNRAF